jgi:hypothetical protein
MCDGRKNQKPGTLRIRRATAQEMRLPEGLTDGGLKTIAFCRVDMVTHPRYPTKGI